ncbi:hypothetical protein N431DRAFT_461872 [Stipitochalara longipes BDJ]|nr:hypothetical protein N431DRAFT_461872 [Stipitochalara longipes BDJ]
MDRTPLRRTRDKILSILPFKKHLPKPSSSLPSNPEPITSLLTPLSEETITKPSGIEALPLELRLHILSAIPNLQSLKYLLRASPAYYRAFQGSKRKILKSVIERELKPSLLVEAKAVCKAKRVGRDEKWMASVGDVLREWRDERKVVAEKKTMGNGMEGGGTEVEVDEDDVIEIVNLYLLVQRLTGEFCADALRPVSDGLTKREGKGREWDREISELERCRIQRAMFRFETFVALFGEKKFRPSYRPERFREQEMADLYFGSEGMKAWEVEELACVRDWMYRVYGSVLEETRELVWEMDVESERDELRCFMEEGWKMEERAKRQVMKRDEYWERDQREVLLMLGLPFLAKIMEARSAQRKFELLKEHLIISYMDAPDFLTKALEAEPGPSRAGHGHGHRRARIEFEGDIETGPNMAWVQSKGIKNREDQERWFEDEAERWREWGYCLWDEERLKEWGFGHWSWRNGERRIKGRWVWITQARPSGRVVGRWVWVVDGVK